MRPQRRLLYWLFTGALFGLGLSVSFGLPFLALGLVLLLQGLARVGGQGFWGVLVTLGAIPALFTLVTFLTLQPCPPEADPATARALCGELPASYGYSALTFGFTALAGLLWGLRDLRRWRRTGSLAP